MSILNFPFSSVIPPEIRMESTVSIEIVAKDKLSEVSKSINLPFTVIFGC